MEEKYDLHSEFDIEKHKKTFPHYLEVIIDPDGKVKVYEIHDMGIGRNAKELLRKVQAAKFVREHGDEVCPAKWTPGEETLKPSLDLVGLL